MYIYIYYIPHKVVILLWLSIKVNHLVYKFQCWIILLELVFSLKLLKEAGTSGLQPSTLPQTLSTIYRPLCFF